jgi:ABC-type uncharacterized transport system substrate-binding protein
LLRCRVRKWHEPADPGCPVTGSLSGDKRTTYARCEVFSVWNATGLALFEFGISAKWLEVLQEIAPSVTRIAILRDVSLVGLFTKRIGLLHELVPMAAVMAMIVNPDSPILEEDLKPVLATAQALGLTLHVMNASTERDLDAAFDAVPRLRVGALALQGEPFFDSRRDRIVELAERQAIPVIYAWREYVVAGGLMSYGTHLIDNYRQAGIYVGRVLKGEKPAEMPIVRPTKFDLVINLKTAKALGLIIPPTLLSTADEVIE